MRTGTRIRLSLESKENKGRSRSTALHSIPGPSGLPPLRAPAKSRKGFIPSSPTGRLGHRLIAL